MNYNASMDTLSDNETIGSQDRIMDTLIENIDKLHTTPMGVDRIKRNLKLETDDAVGYCKDLILSPKCRIARRGKNWYCEIGNIRITVNSYSYTIITAHTAKSIAARLQ